MDQLREHVIEGEDAETTRRVTQLLADGADPMTLLRDALVPAMDRVGQLFQDGEYFIPELLIAARAMKAGIKVLKPKLVEQGVPAMGTVVLGTVSGDRHDIGKNLVGMILEGAGFDVVDLGVDVPADAFITAIREHAPLAVGMSSLLTVTMTHMAQIISAIETAGLRDATKILVGGAPVTQAYADEIGADFFGEDPMAAKNYLLSLE